ncbi:caspase family protein [Bacteroidota bacterium]
MNNRKLVIYVISAIILSFPVLLYSQEVKSKTVRFHINNLPPEKPEPIFVEPDIQPPVIDIISPDAMTGNIYITSKEKITLIGEISDESEIKFISVNSDIGSVNESGIFISELQLAPGINSIRLVAMDDNNNIQEQYLSIEYVPPVVSLADKIINESKYYGLIIGIDDYNDNDLPDLGNPTRDAERLYSSLTTKYTFREEDMILLKDATRAEIIEGFEKLARIITPNDNLVIFYAGHGWWDEESNIGYWLPSDADGSVKTNWFRNSTLVDYLKEIDSKHTLLITDACFGGSIFKTRSAFPNQDKAYEKLYELPSRKAMTSGALSEVPDRSSFTRFLIQRLNDNEETYLSSEQLFSSFRIAVLNNSDAIPQYGEVGNVGDQGGDFIFIRRK